VKRRIEHCTGTKLVFDSETGEVQIESTSDNPLGVLKAREILRAIARGFSPERAFRLLEDDQYLEIIDIRDFAQSEKALSRLKGRAIGEQGKTRRIIEEASDVYISIYGKTISLIGDAERLAIAREAIQMLLEGAKHSSVYRFLERRRKEMRRAFSKR
jgi:ribosomal RNA assembly protein